MNARTSKSEKSTNTDREKKREKLGFLEIDAINSQLESKFVYTASYCWAKSRITKGRRWRQLGTSDLQKSETRREMWACSFPNVWKLMFPRDSEKEEKKIAAFSSRCVRFGGIVGPWHRRQVANCLSSINIWDNLGKTIRSLDRATLRKSTR